MFLSRQTRVCGDKTFVETKLILVAAPASDTGMVPKETLKVFPEGRTPRTRRRLTVGQGDGAAVDADGKLVVTVARGEGVRQSVAVCVSAS